MKFLIIDDNPADRELIMRLLQREFRGSKFVNVIQHSDFDEAITRRDFDVVITEYCLNWADGLWILKRIRERLPYIPVIMVTHTKREETVVADIKSGLNGFILKKHLHSLPATVRESVEKVKWLKRFERCCGVHATMRILAESATLHEAIPKILQTICESLDWTVGEFWVMDSKTNELRFVEAWHKPSVKVSAFEAQSRQIVFPPGSGLPGSVYASRKPVWITDVVNDINFHRAAIAAKEELHGALGFPIMSENDVLGIFVFLSHEIQPTDEDLLMILTSIGSQIGQFIKRKQAEDSLHQAHAELEQRIRERTTAMAQANEALRKEIIEHKMADEALLKSEERFRKLAEKVQLILWEADARTRKFTYIGPKAAEILGYPSETWYTANFWIEHIHPKDREWAVNYCAEMSMLHENYEFEYRMLAADGQIVWLRDIVNVVRDEVGPKILRGFMIDITKRKRIEEELKALNESLEKRIEERTKELVKVNEELQVKIADRKMIEDALYASEARYRNLFENSPVSLWEEDLSEVKTCIDSLRESGITDFRTYFDNHSEVIHKCAAKVKIIDVNKATLKMYKAKSKKQILRGLSQSFDKELFDVCKQALIALAEGKTAFEAEAITRTLNGSKNCVFLRMSMAPGFEQTWARVFVSLTDITERKWIEDALKRRIDLEKTIAGISTRFVILSDFNNTIYKSLADAGRLSKAGRAYLFQFRDNGKIMDNTHEWCDEGVAPEIQSLQDLPTAMFPWFMENLRAGTVIHIPDVSKMPPERDFDKAFPKKQGIKSLLVLPVYAETDLVGFLGFDNVVTAGPWHEEDITLLRIMSEIIGSAIARKRSEALITYMAYHDTLTSLPNRNLLKDRLQVAVVHAKRNKSMAAVMVLDLDNFKTINDTLGHHVGDLLLKAVAERLKRCVRESDTVARTGGDEFTVILYDLAHVEDAATVAQKFLDALYQSFQFEGREVNITTSIGISLYPLDAEETENLVKNADIAMYLSKEHGKNTYRFYKSDMNTHG